MFYNIKAIDVWSINSMQTAFSNLTFKRKQFVVNTDFAQMLADIVISVYLQFPALTFTALWFIFRTAVGVIFHYDFGIENYNPIKI